MQNLTIINNQLGGIDLFDSFKKQLRKDFEQSNFPADFVDTLEPEYSSIHKKIVLELQRNVGKSDVDVMQLLYRIDISEAQLKKYLHATKNENYFNILAELMIKRVLQKVVIKQFYKSNENS